MTIREEIDIIMRYFEVSEAEAMTAPSGILNILGIRYDKATDTISRDPQAALNAQDLERCRKLIEEINNKNISGLTSYLTA